MKAIENGDSVYSDWFRGLGGCAPVMSLASVRYYADYPAETAHVPYGYSPAAKDGGGILYESPNAMPLGYTYDAVMGRGEWDALPVLRKQQAMMQAAVVEEADKESGDISLSRSLPEYEERKLPYTLVSLDNMEWNRETGDLHIGEGGGTLSISFDGIKDGETYVRLVGFDPDFSGYETVNLGIAEGGQIVKQTHVATARSPMNGDFRDFIYAVGNGSQEHFDVQIGFYNSGNFKLKDLEVYGLPMEKFEEQAQLRRSESLDAQLVGNHVSGDITVSSDKLLCLSLPYSKGWTATVDGKKTKVQKCNVMYMGVMLPEGTHHVEFTYRTPGLFVGFLVSLISAIGIFMWNRERKVKNET